MILIMKLWSIVLTKLIAEVSEHGDIVKRKVSLKGGHAGKVKLTTVISTN